MKRKWGVLAMLLPLKGHHPSFDIIKPLQTGDVIAGDVLNQITLHAPATLPLSLFKNKRLVLNILAVPYGSQIAVFEMNTLGRWLYGRAHMPVITSRPAMSLCGALGNEGSAINMQLPLVAATTELTELFAHHLLPHMVLIGANGKVQAIIEGGYVSVAQTKGSRRQSAGLIQMSTEKGK